MTRVAILATGNEILSGDTLNTTTPYMARQFTSEGFEPVFFMTCSDREDDIAESIAWLAGKADILVISGGLGPTSDDRTRFALARWLDSRLLEIPEALEHVRTHLRNSPIAENAGNRQQCLFPEGTQILPNPNGTAVGGYLFRNNRHILLLPGPPGECLPMFDHHAMPLLRQCQRSDMELLRWRVFGVAESVLGETMEEALAGIPCEIGYRLDTPYIEFKVRCIPSETPGIRKIVEPLLAEAVISPPNKRASDELREKLTSLEIPISICDNATGGRLETLLLRPENYSHLTFGNPDKATVRFQCRGLEAFWNQVPDICETSVEIQATYGNTIWKDTRVLGFRSPMVVLSASEWLCFRMLHFLDLLHQ